MPLRTVGPDSNGLYYQAVTTAEWSGDYGAQLRAAGYTYCGYGTWGVYVAGPGEPCSSSSPAGGGPPPPPPDSGGGPMILPPAPGGDPILIGGDSLSSGCGCGKRIVDRPTVGGLPRPATAPAPTAAAEPERIPRWLWWVIIILIILVLLRG